MATTQELLNQAQSQAQELKSSFESFKANRQGEVPVTVMENPQAQAELPTPEVNSGQVDSAVAAAKQAEQTAQANLTAAQQKEAKDTSSVNELMESVGGRGAERIERLEEKGVPTQNKQLADLLTTIRSKTAGISQFDDESVLGEEALRIESGKLGGTKGQFDASARERRLQRAVSRVGLAAELRSDIAVAELMQNNIMAATAEVDAALEAMYDPLEQQLENEMFFLQRQWQQSDKADERLFAARQQTLEQEIQVITDAKDMVNNAMSYATPDELKEMMDADLSPKERYNMAQGVVARGLRKDRMDELSQRNLDRALSNAELKALLGESSVDEVIDTAYTEMNEAVTANSVNDFLSLLMSDKSISAGARSTIATQMQVNDTLLRLQMNNPEGEFRGFGPGLQSVGAPVDYALDMFLGSDNYGERIRNSAARANLEAQYIKWATGAAATDEQLESYKKSLISESDSDRKVKEKMNQMYNTMNDYTESVLRSSGYNVQIPEVDLFEEADILSELTPEELRIYNETRGYYQSSVATGGNNVKSW